MPRIYTSTSDPLDFCLRCYPKPEEAARKRYGDLGDGPDGRGNCFGYDAEHPEYEDTETHCNRCNKKLREVDNYVP